MKKSQASVLAPCWRRNARHDGPARSGAGGTPRRAKIVRTDVADTLMPSFPSSPAIRRCPQPGFSRARRTTSPCRLRSSGGRPRPLRADVQRRATRLRCQRSSVAGVTEKIGHDVREAPG